MLREFLAWYGQTLAELLPPSLRRGKTAPDAVLVQAEADGTLAQSRSRGLTLALRRAGRVAELGDLKADAPPAAIRRRLGRRPPSLVVLQLPAPFLLERGIALPIAAEAEHRNLLRYEMDRYTPFRAEDAFWTTTVERRDRARGKLHLRLSLVPRATLGDLLDRLAAAGLAPARLEVADAEDGHRGIDLGARDGRGTTPLRAAGIACAGLALVAIALPFLMQWREAARIEARIALLEPRAAEATTMRRRIAERGSGAGALSAEQARLGDALRVLATVTDILPDDTSLTSFGLKQRHLTLEGQAASAAALIPRLAGDELVREPRFAAPVTRNGGGTAELFSIRAEIVP